MYSAEKIVINSGEKDRFYEDIRALDIMNTEHFRPSWDTYFMRLAEMAATRTNCMKRGVGAVVVYNNRLISAGYNGTPKGTINCIDGGCLRCKLQAEQGTMLEDCMCMHGELNAILFAGYENCEGTTLYTTLFPCLLCSKSIVQAGIIRVVYEEEYNHSDLSLQLLQQANVAIYRHSSVVPSPFR
jgi:dCMP deaminase